MKKILLTQTAFLGDVVLATPIIDILKSYFPNDELHLLTTPLASKLFCSDDRVHQVHTLQKKSPVGSFLDTQKLSLIHI